VLHSADVERVATLSAQWSTTYWASAPKTVHRSVTESLPTLYECFNQADLLITDISSVVADYLHSEKPYAVTNSKKLDHETFRHLYPTASAAELLDPDCATLSEVVTNLAAGVDRYADQRLKLKEHLLGADDLSPQQRFNAALDRAIAAADAAPRPDDWSTETAEREV
jgi:CDP-glycerol glycerophosphotransferase (TagB/SpsB family)